MNFLPEFKKYLFSQSKPSSKVTVKNYISDISRFVRWFEKKFNSFSPELVTSQILEQFRESNSLAISSKERNISSLRKFFNFLKLEGHISSSPFEESNNVVMEQSDPWKLKAFKDYLYVYNASKLTIKNYLMDLRNFIKWFETVTKNENAWDLKEIPSLSLIDRNIIEEYKRRLPYSPRTINRKLSSLRKYLKWAESEGLVQARGDEVEGTEHLRVRLQTKWTGVETTRIPNNGPTGSREYSKFPPLRLAQKIFRTIIFIPEFVLIDPVSSVIQAFEHAIWRLRGKPVFQRTKSKKLRIRSIKKEVFAPFAISTKHFPLHKKLFFHLAHTRPNWYKVYHSYSVSHYLHMAVLILVMSALGFSLYQNFLKQPQSQAVLGFANPQSPPRILSFQGRLTDSSDNPITKTTMLRFAIYDADIASGSALKWQEVDTVTPDSDGIFSVILGNGSTMQQSLFAEHAALWLGVSVGKTAELTPRQRLATVAYAENAESLQGLIPITQTNAGQTNVVLALDSSGNLTIAGTATPTFQATGGQFTLSGNPLLLTTTSGSNANVNVNPNGRSFIDLQKPLQNSTKNNNVSTALGALEVDDLVAILATSSGQSALTINQNSTGPILSASSSGTAKFTVDNSGNTSLAGNLTISGTTLTGSSLTTANLGSAALTIGAITSSGNFSQTGATTFSTGTGAISLNGATTAGSTLAVTGTTSLNGAVNIGSATTNDIAVNGRVTTSFVPKLTANVDLGSTSLRWNNLWVQTINTTGTNTSGQATFTSSPATTAISDSTVFINPTTASADVALLGVAVAGAEKSRIDAEGDLILGYNSATATLASDPFNVYNHGTTRVAAINTSGNLTIAAGQGIDTLAAGTLGVGNTTATTVNIGNTAATTLTLGSGGALTRTISIGTGTGADTINIGTGTVTADTISIGGLASTVIATTGTLTHTGTANINTSGTATTAIGNSTGSLTLVSGGTSSWTNTSGNLTISTATSGTLALTSAGALNLTAGAASIFALPSNTASAFKFTDGTNAYETIDTRTATSGVSAFTWTPGTAPTIASAATAYFNTGTFTPGTVNFSGSTQITSTGTSANNSLLFNQPTINRTAAATNLTIDQASNLFINGPSIATHASVGQTETITTSSALRIAAGSALNGTNGAVTNGYGLYVDAPTGATNNYAATFASGNVGIGTTAPTGQLQISGSAAGSMLVLKNTGGTNPWQIGEGADDRLAILYNQSEKITINSSGNLLFGTDNAADIGASGATRPRSLYFGTALIGPGTVASTGDIRLSNTGSIYARNAANTLNLALIYSDSGDITQIGNASGNGARVNSFIELADSGAVVSTTGALRMRNNAYIYGRNAANSANVGMIGINTSNEVDLGAGTSVPVRANSTLAVGGNLTFSTDNSFDIGASGATRPRDLYLANSVKIGANPATDGLIRVPSAGGVFVIKYRNAANTADLVMLQTDGANNIYFGGTGVPGAYIGAGVPLLFNTDNAADIGAAAVSRPRSIYLGTLTAASATTVCRDANGGLSTCSSSRKFKDNINYLSDSQLSDILGQITDSRLATFTYKTDRPDLTRYGIIAEEAPLPLRIIDPNGNNNIDFYSAQFGYTWAGIKALNQKLSAIFKNSCVQSQSSSDFGLVKNVCSQTTIEKLVGSGAYTVKNSLGEVATGGQILAEAVIGNLKAGFIQTRELLADTINVNNKIISPIAEVQTIRTNTITPLSSNKVVVKLDASASSASRSAAPSLEIQNASGSAVVSITDKGDASFSGRLSSRGLNTEEATVSGTLRAKNLVADNITSQILNLKSSILNLTAPLSSSSAKNVDIASYSAQLANVDTLQAQVGTFMSGLFAIGPTSLSDATVFGQLSIGGNLILADSSINVLGNDLKLQPLGQGGILLGKKIAIDASGNLSVNGDARFNGNLFAGVISPIPGQDLVFKLLNKNASDSAKFIVQNASGSAVASIDNNGNVYTEGNLTARSALFNKLTLNIVSPALALSEHEFIATGSAGIATVSAHLKEVTILNKLVTNKSLIYITPVGPPAGGTSAVPFLERQDPNKSFTVGIQNEKADPTSFNWLIIN